MDYKNMTIEEILKVNPRSYEVLESYGLHCITCNGASTDTLGIGARVHRCDLEEIIEKLNEIEKK